MLIHGMRKSRSLSLLHWQGSISFVSPIQKPQPTTLVLVLCCLSLATIASQGDFGVKVTLGGPFTFQGPHKSSFLTTRIAVQAQI